MFWFKAQVNQTKVWYILKGDLYATISQSGSHSFWANVSDSEKQVSPLQYGTSVFITVKSLGNFWK